MKKKNDSYGEKLMKIPLGLSSYKEIVTEGYYYVDKTRHIETLENLSTKYNIIFRPRRFGKTLLWDTIRCYYDIAEKNNFDMLFGNTYIGKHKTKLANSYYMLHLNLSWLDTRDSERLETAFGRSVVTRIKSFVGKYGLNITIDENIHFVSYMDRFLNELQSCIPEKSLFILIDEYDHFANSLLSSKEAFQAATSKEGFIRNFYEVIKLHTQTVVSRIYITGVTSLTLDSLTSGFNICENVSDYPILNDALGFTFDEVYDLVNHMGVSDPENVLSILKENYNGYLFSPDSRVRIYNSNMILYFFNSYQNRGFPRNLEDPNIRGDYLKLEAMFDLYAEGIEKKMVLQKLMRGEYMAGN